MENEFKSLDELYKRLTPALISRCDEFRRLGYKDIKEIDIWNYLTNHKWKMSVDLTINDMVNDIFNVDATRIIYCMVKK